MNVGKGEERGEKGEKGVDACKMGGEIRCGSKEWSQLEDDVLSNIHCFNFNLRIQFPRIHQ